MIKKYFLQILIVLLMLTIAWILVSLKEVKPSLTEALNKPIQANINQSGGDKTAVNPQFFPMRNWLVDEPEISAQSGIIINFKTENEKNNILYQKNSNQVLPIASLSKIMTAIVVLENYDFEEVIKVSDKSVTTTGDTGGLIRDEDLRVKDLLYIMLMESSNDAAMALAGDNPRLSYNEFINLMNSKAKELGLKNTAFIDPMGLDPRNKSTATEIAELTKYALKFPLILEIFKTQNTTVSSIDNKFIHNLTSTNKLLGRIPQIIGGKTGFTEEAGGCMLMVSSLSNANYLITVILGSNEREIDMEKLVIWAQQAYIWQ